MDTVFMENIIFEYLKERKNVTGCEFTKVLVDRHGR